MTTEQTPAPTERAETDEELLSIPDPNVTGKLIGDVIEGPTDADR